MYAVIDIGTLKIKFHIASISSDDEIIEHYSSNTLTCFGCELDKNNGFVKEENLKKTIEELKRCKSMLKKYQVKKYRIVSTHAMRKAKNKDEILKRIKKEVGFGVENITQEQEAELFFKAVMRDFENDSRDFAVLDIGGGSVQILVGNSKKLKDTHMMQSGAQFLHDNFTKDANNPKSFTNLEEIEKMKDHIVKELLPFERKINLPIIYGSSNIIDLMKAVELPLEKRNSKIHPYKTYAKHLQQFIQKILPLNNQEREKLYKFQKGYLWGVDKAFLNVSTIAEYLNSPYIIPTNANIAQGFILEMKKR